MMIDPRPPQTQLLISAIKQHARDTIRTDELARLTGVRAGAIRSLLEREINARRIIATPVKLPGIRIQHNYRVGQYGMPYRQPVRSGSIRRTTVTTYATETNTGANP